MDDFAAALGGGHARQRHLRRPVARALAHLTPRLTPAMVDVLAADSVSDGAASADRVLGMRLHSVADAYASAA